MYVYMMYVYIYIYNIYIYIYNVYIYFRAARYIACDSHAHLVSKDGSAISRKSPSPVFKWSGI